MLDHSAILKGLTIIAVAVCATGCGAHTAVVSQERNAYVVKGSLFGSSMYHCQASGGSPVCTEVTEVEDK